MKRPDVAVVICCYNHAGFLHQALDSVAEQTLRPTQLIVTDDASTDGSEVLIQQWIAQNWPGAVFLRNETNIGLPRTLNKVRPLLDGDLVVIMSADDWMVADRLERQVEAFSSDPAVGMVYSDMTEVDAAGLPTGQRWFDLDRMGPASSGDLFPLMIRRAFMSAPSVMVRRELLMSVGPYDEQLVAEDYDMFLRLSRRAAWAYIADPLVNYRVLASSLSRSTQFRSSYRVGRIALLRRHVGVSEDTDQVIAARTAQMAESLYKEGRNPRDTAADLRFAMGIRPSARVLLFWLLASARVPGPTLVRLGRAVRPARRWTGGMQRFGRMRSSVLGERKA